MSHIADGELSSDPDLCKFTDVDNMKVTFLCGMGIINGKSETEFAPNDSLTREEAATILLRMINKVKPMARDRDMVRFRRLGGYIRLGVKLRPDDLQHGLYGGA